MPGTPLPGRPVRGSDTGRPIMALLDLLGRRWSLRVLWELREEPATFRELQQRSGGVSSSVLAQRHHELSEAALVERVSDGYALSRQGRSLLGHLEPLDAWARSWRPSTDPHGPDTATR